MLWKFAAAALAALALPLAPAFAQEGHHHAATKGERIKVTVQGQGRDVILIPGLTSHPRIWASTVEAVPGYRYHLVQVAGFAGLANTGNTEGEVIHPLAHAIYEYIKSNKLAKPAIVGHSMGGTLAMLLAAHHPEAVGKVMVVDMLPFTGAMFGPGVTAETVKPIADGIRAQMASATPEARQAFIKQTVDGMTTVAAERPKILAESLASDQELVGRAYYEIMVTDLRPELSKIAAPTTVLYVTPKGVPVNDAQVDGFYTASYTNLKSARLVRVPEAAHFIMLDNPARFQSELKAFLE